MDCRPLKKKDAGQSSGSIIRAGKAALPCFHFSFYSHKTNAALKARHPLTLGVPSGRQHGDGASHPHLGGVWRVVGHVSSRGRQVKRTANVGKNRVQLRFLLDSLLLRRDTGEGEGFIEPPPTDAHPPPLIHTTQLNIHQDPANHLQETFTERRCTWHSCDVTPDQLVQMYYFILAADIREGKVLVVGKKHTCFWFVLHLFAFEKFIQTFWTVHELWN